MKIYYAIEEYITVDDKMTVEQIVDFHHSIIRLKGKRKVRWLKNGAQN